MQTVSYDKRFSILYCRCRCPRSTGWVSRKDPRNSTISWSPSWRVRAALRLAGGRPPWPGGRPGSAGTPPCSPSYNYLAAHRLILQNFVSHTFVRLALVNPAIQERIHRISGHENFWKNQAKKLVPLACDAPSVKSRNFSWKHMSKSRHFRRERLGTFHLLQFFTISALESKMLWFWYVICFGQKLLLFTGGASKARGTFFCLFFILKCDLSDMTVTIVVKLRV